MTLAPRASIRTRLTVWYVSVLAVLLLVYAAIVFLFQYGTLTKQLFHDEVQDVVTVEGLLYFDAHGSLQLHQDYFSRPQSHLLVDRFMEVRDLAGKTLYRSTTLHGWSLGGPNRPNEGDASFNERVVRLPDGQYVFLISHVHGLGGQTLLIRLGYSLAPLRERMKQFLLLLLIALPIALTIAAFAGQAIASKALEPLESMAMRAQGISASSLHDRLTVVNPEDELGRLAAVFNHLLQRLEEAFLELHRFTADVAHELRTPLASLRTVGEVAIESERSPEAYRDAISSILEAAAQLTETIDSLLLLSRAEATTLGATRQTFTVGALVSEVLGVLAILIDERQLTVLQREQDAAAIEILADRAFMRIALLNVVHNAIKYSPVGSTLRVDINLPPAEDVVQIVVEDQGPGLRAGEHERVFERFYRGLPDGAEQLPGTGLGLSIAKRVVEIAGGAVWFDTGMITGARCFVQLPLVHDQP